LAVTFCMPPIDFFSSPKSRHPEQDTAAGKVAVLLLADIKPAYRLWGYARFIIQRLVMRTVPGLVFSQVMGSGYNGGFGLRPSSSRQALFCLFVDEASADAFLTSDMTLSYEMRSREFCTTKLRAYSCKGSWAGRTIAVTVDAPEAGPIATLTRASIRPLRAWHFWRMQPASELALAQASGCLLATGVGEAPFLRQATFSLWSSVTAMNAYARGGAHLAAIRAAYDGAFFSESMFVRFVPIGLCGRWRGQRYG
jgi:hypothetical protein